MVSAKAAPGKLKKIQPVAERKKANDLGVEERWAIIAWCNQYYDVSNGVYMKGCYPAAEQHFAKRVGQAAIRKIVGDYRKMATAFPSFAAKPKTGRESHLTEKMRENIIDLHMMSEGTLSVWRFAKLYEAEFGEPIHERSMARYLKQMGATDCRTYLAPMLSTKQRLDRLEFIEKKVEWSGHEWRFKKPNAVVVHSDEKWFYTEQLKTVKRWFPGMERPKRNKIGHKSHIPKMMFNSVIGRPQTLANGQHFDGKICIIPLVDEDAVAKKNSKNRPAGAPVIECINVNSATYLDMFVKPGGIFERIRAKIPDRSIRVVVQHDNAKPHTGKGNREKLRSVGEQQNITFEEQPPQSPDFNFNDLAFFYSLQCDTNELKGENCDLFKLKESVLQAYRDYPQDKLERIEAIQHEIYRQVIEHDGGNDFPMPHSGIRNRQRNEGEVVDRSVPTELYQRMIATIQKLRAGDM